MSGGGLSVWSSSNGSRCGASTASSSKQLCILPGLVVSRLCASLPEATGVVSLHADARSSVSRGFSALLREKALFRSKRTPRGTRRFSVQRFVPTAVVEDLNVVAMPASNGFHLAA